MEYSRICKTRFVVRSTYEVSGESDNYVRVGDTLILKENDFEVLVPSEQVREKLIELIDKEIAEKQKLIEIIEREIENLRKKYKEVNA